MRIVPPLPLSAREQPHVQLKIVSVDTPNFTPRTRSRFRSTQNRISSRISRLRIQHKAEGLTRQIAEEVLELCKVVISQIPGNGPDIRFLHLMLRKLMFSEEMHSENFGVTKQDLELANHRLQLELQTLKCHVGAKDTMIKKLQKQVSESQEQCRLFREKDAELVRMRNKLQEKEDEFKERTLLAQVQAQ